MPVQDLPAQLRALAARRPDDAAALTAAAEEIEHARRHKALTQLASASHAMLPSCSVEVSMVAQAISDFMLQRLGHRPVRLDRAHNWKSFCDKAPELVAYVRHNSDRQVEQRLLLVLLVELLYEWWKSRGVSASANLLLGSIDQIPGLVEAQLPGYARIGKVGWALLRKGHHD